MRKIILATPYGVFTVLTLALIAYLSLADDPFSSSHLLAFKGADKVVHCLLYFFATIVVILDFAKWRLPHHVKKEKMLAFASFMIVYGALMEVGQLAMQGGRSFDLWDILANAVGVTLAMVVLIYWLMHEFRKAFYYSLHHHHHHHHHSSHTHHDSELKFEQNQELKERIERMAQNEQDL